MLHDQTAFSIQCINESRVISNVRSEPFWSTLDDLIVVLLRSSKFSAEDLLFSWKKEPRHSASAREVYAWRAALDEIKNSDLGTKCSEFHTDKEKFVLITDKPTMLKIAGEITNSLLHSYNSRHNISFGPTQRASNVPS